MLGVMDLSLRYSFLLVEFYGPWEEHVIRHSLLLPKVLHLAADVKNMDDMKHYLLLLQLFGIFLVYILIMHGLHITGIISLECLNLVFWLKDNAALPPKHKQIACGINT